MRIILSYLSYAWAMVNALVRAFVQWRGQDQFSVPVISVGNIVAGGVGKTEVAALIARHFVSQGLRTVVALRGYRSHWEKSSAISDSFNHAVQEKFPDEALVLLKKVPGLWVCVGKNRVNNLKQYWNQLKPEIIIMDDGYQYFKLHRDLDVLVHDFRKAHPIYRDFNFHLRKVPLCLVFSNLPPSVPPLPAVRAEYQLLGMENMEGIQADLPNHCFLFCGVANPFRVVESLKKNQVEVVDSLFLLDHETYSEKTIRLILKRFEQAKKRTGLKDMVLLTTLKDFVKWIPLIDKHPDRKTLPLHWIRIQINLIEQPELLWQSLAPFFKKEVQR